MELDFPPTNGQCSAYAGCRLATGATIDMHSKGAPSCIPAHGQGPQSGRSGRGTPDHAVGTTAVQCMMQLDAQNLRSLCSVQDVLVQSTAPAVYGKHVVLSTG